MNKELVRILVLLERNGNYAILVYLEHQVICQYTYHSLEYHVRSIFQTSVSSFMHQ